MCVPVIARPTTSRTLSTTTGTGCRLPSASSPIHAGMMLAVCMPVSVTLAAVTGWSVVLLPAASAGTATMTTLRVETTPLASPSLE